MQPTTPLPPPPQLGDHASKRQSVAPPSSSSAVHLSSPSSHQQPPPSINNPQKRQSILGGKKTSINAGDGTPVGSLSRSTLPRGSMLGNASSSRIGANAYTSSTVGVTGSGKNHSLMGTSGNKSMQGNMLGLASSITVGQGFGGPGSLLNGVQVLDEDGNDVTPIPLVSHARVAPNLYGKTVMGGASTTEVSIASMTKETVADVLNNLESMTVGSWNASMFGRSGVSFSNSSRNSTSSSDDEKDHGSSYDSANDSDDREDAPPIRASTTHSGKTTTDPDKASTKIGSSKSLSEVELNKLRDIYLTETDTIWLLDIPSIAVSNDFTEEVAMVRERNAKYTELLGSRANNENFTERGMQTFNHFLKNKEVQVTGPTHTTAECQVTRWSIYDSYADRRSDRIDTASDTKETDIDIDIPITTDASTSTTDQSTALGPAESMMLPSGPAVGGDGSGSMMASRSVFFNDDTASEANFSMHVGGAGVGVAGNVTVDDGFDKDGLNLSMLNQDTLRASLLIMERAVVGNTYEKKHLLYRNIDEEAAAAARLQHLQDISQEAEKLIDEAHAEEEEEEEKREEEEVMEAEKKNAEVGAGIPTLNALWSYRCELTRGRTVMYMAWNKQNEDILAVAYAESKTTTSPVLGLVLCWSPKNPEWPERIYRSTSPITAIDFSRTNPNLLAVGFMDGRIAVYDVRRKEDRPVLDSNDHAGKHRDPVWELKWVDRERVIGDDQSRGETLVSVSTDGRVCQWMIRKGFEYTDLMTLKRVTRQQETKPNAGGHGGPGSKTSAFIARQAGGLCFDFNPNDSNIYIVGTEDGYIHRCSCSYNEQYLTTQFGHTGSVYKIKYSPFLSTYFLSCSADWTVRLWGVDDEDAIFKFQSGKDAITDIAWSWNSATVFGCVSNDGRMEIWDLQFSVLDPAILHTVLDRRLTAIIFAARSPTVLIGDDNGTVSVFNLRGGSLAKMTVQGTSVPKHVMEEQAAVLARVIANKNQTVTSVGGGGGAEV